MRRVFGILCILLGLAGVGIGLNLLQSNQEREQKVADFVDRVLPQLEVLPENPTGTEPEGEAYLLLDGMAYLGTLEFPSLELCLPVLAEYDDQNIELAPCRYSGTQADGNLVIAGHNYARHFHYVSGLEVGETVRFTDARGQVFCYQIAQREILDGTAVEKMIAGDWDMTLFTCTYGGKGRVALRCRYLS